MLVVGVSDKIEEAPFAETGVTCALLCWTTQEFEGEKRKGSSCTHSAVVLPH